MVFLITEQKTMPILKLWMEKYFKTIANQLKIYLGNRQWGSQKSTSFPEEIFIVFTTLSFTIDKSFSSNTRKKHHTVPNAFCAGSIITKLPDIDDDDDDETL